MLVLGNLLYWDIVGHFRGNSGLGLQGDEAGGLEGRSENFASQRRFIEFYGDNEKMTPNSSSDALATK